MDEAGAALPLAHESAMTSALLELLKNPARIKSLQEKGLQFSREKAGVIDTVMNRLEPLLQQAGISAGKKDEEAETVNFPEPKRTCG